MSEGEIGNLDVVLSLVGEDPIDGADQTAGAAPAFITDNLEVDKLDPGADTPLVVPRQAFTANDSGQMSPMSIAVPPLIRLDDPGIGCEIEGESDAAVG